MKDTLSNANEFGEFEGVTASLRCTEGNIETLEDTFSNANELDQRIRTHDTTSSPAGCIISLHPGILAGMTNRTRLVESSTFPVPLTSQSRQITELFAQDGALIPPGASKSVRTLLAEVDRLRALLVEHGVEDTELVALQKHADLVDEAELADVDEALVDEGRDRLRRVQAGLDEANAGEATRQAEKPDRIRTMLAAWQNRDMI